MNDDRVTDLFLSLGPEQVLDAVEAAGLDCAPVCHPLNSFENRVYDTVLRDGSRVIAKFYRPGRWTEAQILEEHAFLAELAEDEVPVCGVRPFPDGATLKRIEGIWYCLHDRAPGRAPEDLDDAIVEQMGRLAARLHNVGARRDAPERTRLTAEGYAWPAIAWLSEREVLPPSLRRRWLAAAGALAALADRRLEGVAMHRIHGDLHSGNLLLRDGCLRLLDFDDLMVGPAVQDLWLLLPGRDGHTARQREVFLEGYEQFRSFDRSTLALVEPLRGLRRIHYAAWLARRWHDPLFPATWPQFGTEDWWESETADLEEVLALANHPDAVGLEAAPAAADAEVPTNADLFWDWEEPKEGGR